MLKNMPSFEGHASSKSYQKILDKIGKISNKPDEEILHIIRKLSAKNAALWKMISEGRSSSKRIKVHRCASVQYNIFKETKSIAEDNESTNKSLLHSVYSKNIGLRETVESIFEKLISQYSSTSWCKLENKSLLHIAALKQFWFDCCLCDQKFYTLLLDSLPNKVWINAQGFFKSMAAAQKVSAFNVFSLKRYDKKVQKCFSVQKMLYFFCCVQYDFGSGLTKDQLFKVLVMANKKEKTQIMMQVDWFISAANTQRGFNQDFIKFYEFSALAINSINF
ncbi:hypothetical protein SteCoe_27751 [Stentor coeruleus]|uniref:Uncharacterized protein n=1 Tax=Stentor coeruleus TaxID=5963 RepID=A0A1R2B9T7_9CILI|nr:hypothetical protein SteCoe_27751 [Stentor coeruleus]